MIAILLAAGVGNRLQADHPKALLEIDGKTLLDRHLDNLEALGIPVRVVTGWKQDVLVPHLRDAATVHNPEFRRGSLLSLQHGLTGVDEDAVIMDADVHYDPTILADIVALERGFAIDPRTDPGDEEMMIGVRDGKARTIQRGKLPGFELVGEGVGFFKIDRASLPALRTCIEASDPEGDYEAALNRFIDAHGADYVEVAGRAWTEIDFPEDYEAAKALDLP